MGAGGGGKQEGVGCLQPIRGTLLGVAESINLLTAMQISNQRGCSRD
jgi:hypothetical protein